MTWDLVIRGGRVVDGTGMRSFTADVAIKDGRIAKIGRVDETAKRTLEADGCWVTPGFIDVHTHYDVQLDWDPLATPSSWHGVTSVLAGNCGFTLAPAKPEDVDWLAGMLSRVEGMSRAALGEGLRFEGGGFADYWKRFNGKLGINVGSFVGHSAVRRWVMGDDASEREATPDEISAMQELVRQAMREGAAGFSTSQLDLHCSERRARGAVESRDPPRRSWRWPRCSRSSTAAPSRSSRAASPRATTSRPQAAARPLPGFRPAGRAQHPGAEPHASDGLAVDTRLLQRSLRAGRALHPQFTTNYLELHLKLDDTFVFDEMPELARDAHHARARALERLARRRRTRAAAHGVRERRDSRSVTFEWDGLEVEAVNDPAHARLGRARARRRSRGAR